MEAFSVLLTICAGNSPVTGEFPTQRTVTRSFDVFFDLRLNKRLSKQSWGRWFETPSHPLWRHYNVLLRVKILKVKNLRFKFPGNFAGWHSVLALHMILTQQRVWHPAEMIHIRHRCELSWLMRVKTSQIIGNWTVCSKAYSSWQHRKASKFRIAGSLSHKRPVMWKVFPCHDVIMPLPFSGPHRWPQGRTERKLWGCHFGPHDGTQEVRRPGTAQGDEGTSGKEI